MNKSHRGIHTSNKTRLTGLLIAFVGMPLCIITGTFLWEVSESVSRIIGLWGSLGSAFVGITIACVDNCGSWVHFWFGHYND